MITILLIITILFLFIFQDVIDPYLIHFLNDEQISMIYENPDKVLIKRLRKSKIVLFPLVLWQLFDYSFIYLFVILGLFLFMLKKDDIKIIKGARRQVRLRRFGTENACPFAQRRNS